MKKEVEKFQTKLDNASKSQGRKNKNKELIVASSSTFIM